MEDTISPAVFLSGASGRAPDLSLLKSDGNNRICFATISYPDWQRYVDPAFTAEVLVEELAAQIVIRVPCGPIHIVGMSIGGHIGYAVALHLQKMGRVIAALCIIDAFMIASSAPSTGWLGRALFEAFKLLRKGHMMEVIRFIRSKFWRLLLRLLSGRILSFSRMVISLGYPSVVSKLDPIFESELSMRLLIRKTAPWIASLDRNPVVLDVPTVLLRTRMSTDCDTAWRSRCPNITIHEISGDHHTIFDSENLGSLRTVFSSATRDWW